MSIIVRKPQYIFCDQCGAVRGDRTMDMTIRNAAAEGWLVVQHNPDPGKVLPWEEYYCPNCRADFDCHEQPD